MDKFSYFDLKTDGSVWAWGAGAKGQLAVDTSADRTVPTQVLNPLGESLAGVQKLIFLSRESILLIKESEVYLLGTAFGKTSLSTSTSKVVDITSIFPSFDHADFEVTFVNGLKHLNTLTRASLTGKTAIYANTTSRIFSVSGI